MLFVNSLAWVMYGLLIGNYYIFVPNIFGCNFMLYYTLSVYHLCPPARRQFIRNLLLLGFSFIMLSSLACFVTLIPYDPDESIRKKVMGMTAVIALIIFYSSPLSDMAQILKTKDASSVSLGLALASGVNGLLWTGYGFAILDPVSSFQCQLFR